MREFSGKVNLKFDLNLKICINDWFNLSQDKKQKLYEFIRMSEKDITAMYDKEFKIEQQK